MSKADTPYSDLEGRRAFVTGGAHGIGRAIAAALARRGVSVAVADIDLPAAQAIASEIGGVAVKSTCGAAHRSRPPSHMRSIRWPAATS